MKVTYQKIGLLYSLCPVSFILQAEYAKMVLLENDSVTFVASF